MKYLLLILMAALASGCSVFRGDRDRDEPADEVRRHILERRDIEIRRQAPAMGIPLDQALLTRVSRIHLCAETDRNGDGSISCNRDCTGTECVHAWFRGAAGSRSAEYLFVTPIINDGVIAHEVHHELLVIHYGIFGHPRESVITRIDNGKSQRINHASIIGWRWPSLVNWALPKAWEITPAWGEDLQCGSDELLLIDGAGI